MESASIKTNMFVIEDSDKEKWFWEIYTFELSEESYGSAAERNRAITFPWIKIEEMESTTAMIKICESFMEEIKKEN